jgi:hypothetical protein
MQDLTPDLLPLLVCAVVATGCGPGSSNTASPTDSAECEPRQTAPINVQTLVRVFRAKGISLDVDVRKCMDPNRTSPDATNLGPGGLDGDERITREQGDVLCDLWEKPGERVVGEERKVLVTHYRTDTETYVSVLNVSCAVYPSSAEAEERQVSQVKSALEALVREVQAGP